MATVYTSFLKGISHDDVIYQHKSEEEFLVSWRNLNESVYEVETTAGFKLLVVVTDLVIGETGDNLYKVESSPFPE